MQNAASLALLQQFIQQIHPLEPTSLSPLIRMRLGDTFAFVIAHLERHVLQAEQALQTNRRLLFVDEAASHFTAF
jgi:hypothetical protein